MQRFFTQCSQFSQLCSRKKLLERKISLGFVAKVNVLVLYIVKCTVRQLLCCLTFFEVVKLLKELLTLDDDSR